MSATQKIIAILAILAILVVIPVYFLNEPQNQEEIVHAYRIDAVVSGTDLYAENCAICHGAFGEGIGSNPPLNTDSVKTMLESDLVKTITRGRTNTLMAPWGMEEGGNLTNAQIGDLVELIQTVNWDYVGARVDELGLTPPEIIEVEVSEEMLVSISELPGGDVLSEGFSVYAENCAACHGANGAGTVIAPALDSADLRTQTAAELIELVNNGVPGTLMSGWVNMLPENEIASVVDLIMRWPELYEAGVEFPEVEVMTISSSPEMIAAGERLFNITCKSCHGVGAYGTPMAPALNNEIFLSETPDAAIYQIIAGGVPDTLMPAWGSRLTDYDLQTLVAYLRSLEADAQPILPPVGGN